MPGFKYAAIRSMFELLSLSGITAPLRAVSRSRGVIFTMHRVLPGRPGEFSPNAILRIEPEFLSYAITRVRELGLDVVSLDEAIARLENPPRTKPFAVFTFDDGYRDNLDFALPVLRRHQCPFTLYVPTALIDGVGDIWWQALEDIIAGQKGIGVAIDGGIERFETASLAEKQRTYDTLYWLMRKMPEPERVKMIRAMGVDHDLDLDQHCRELIMDWSELKTFADEPLCTIGAHTVHHYELAKLPPAEARSEIEQSVRIIEARFGKAPQHLSYPIGGPASADEREFALARDLGLKSAVTTRPGGLYHRHKESLHALPRISLNGLFQVRRYVDVFATGAVFSLMGR